MMMMMIKRKKVNQKKAKSKTMKLSPSNAHRWLVCTASAIIEETLPTPPSNKFADEGTAAHKLAEITLNNKSKIVESDNEEMKRNIQVYVDYIYKKSKFENIEVESKFPIFETNNGIVDCSFIKKKTLYIIDLKYGAGQDVDVNNNPQMLLYAIGLLPKYPDIKKVKLVIIQPRTTGIKTQTLKVKDVLKFKNKVEKTIFEIQNNPKLEVGEHCKYCRAESICIARHKLFISALNSKNLIDPMQFKEVLDHSKDVLAFIKSVEEKAYELFKDGKKIPGYKIVRNREVSRWNRAEKHIINKLRKKGFKDIERTSLKPIGELKKFIPQNILEKFIIKSSTGITLVKDSDPRQSITDAERDFSDGNK